MARPTELNKSEVEKDPSLVWNAFIYLIGLSDPRDLNDTQSTAQFAFWYESEVQNGGHLQYFENMHTRHKDNLNLLIAATLDALRALGANEQAVILNAASERYFSANRGHPTTVECFCDLQGEKEFEDLDRRYYGCSPEMDYYFGKFLQANLGEFVKLV